jgi:uncharacterized membrane protein YgdD (TMEM256/DUF423 family)
LKSSARVLLTLAALSGLLSVAMAARAAHGGGDPQVAEWLRTGSTYEVIHALAVFAAMFVAAQGGRRAPTAAVLFLVGQLLFSGGLYALAFGAPRALAMGIPVGGLAFMAGWLVLAWACLGLKPTTR